VLGVLVLTAGLGTRMRTLTRSRPKALMPILGVPALEWVLSMTEGLDAKVAAINVHHLRDCMLEGVWEWNRKAPKKGLQAVEEEVLLGSGGGMVHVAKRFPEVTEWLVLNGDSFLDETLLDFVERAREQALVGGARCVLLALKDFFGLFTSLKGEGTRLLGLSTPEKDGLFFTGVSWWKASWLHTFQAPRPLEFVQDLLEPLIQTQNVGMDVRKSQWFDIGTPRAYYETHMSLLSRWQQRQIPAQWSGVVPATFLRNEVLASPQGSLRESCRIEGLNFLDVAYEGASLGPGAVLYVQPPKDLQVVAKGIWMEEGVWCV
jgi:NDP-sugar pyrophosphorylase family protein